MLAKVSIPVISGKKIHMQQDLISCENVCWRADFAACRSPLSRAAVAQPNVVCSTAGCPKVSPGVAERPTVYDMAFQDCFHPCLLFRSGSCKWSGLIVDFQIQKHRMLCAIDLLILSSLLLSIFWFCCASFSLTQSICLINASIHCSLSGNWYAETNKTKYKGGKGSLFSI